MDGSLIGKAKQNLKAAEDLQASVAKAREDAACLRTDIDTAQKTTAQTMETFIRLARANVPILAGEQTVVDLLLQYAGYKPDDKEARRVAMEVWRNYTLGGSI